MKCGWCDEEVQTWEARAPICGDVVFHHECGFRMVGGSVGHLNKRCCCHGGTEGDPPEMTKRQAAQAALDLWRERNQ